MPPKHTLNKIYSSVHSHHLPLLSHLRDNMVINRRSSPYQGWKILYLIKHDVAAVKRENELVVSGWHLSKWKYCHWNWYTCGHLSVGTEDRRIYWKTDQMTPSISHSLQPRQGWCGKVDKGSQWVLLHLSLCVSSLCPQASVRPGADWSHPRGRFWGGPVERLLVSL